MENIEYSKIFTKYPPECGLDTSPPPGADHSVFYLVSVQVVYIHLTSFSYWPKLPVSSTRDFIWLFFMTTLWIFEGNTLVFLKQGINLYQKCLNTILIRMLPNRTYLAEINRVKKSLKYKYNTWTCLQLKKKKYITVTLLMKVWNSVLNFSLIIAGPGCLIH